MCQSPKTGRDHPIRMGRKLLHRKSKPKLVFGESPLFWNVLWSNIWVMVIMNMVLTAGYHVNQLDVVKCDVDFITPQSIATHPMQE